MSVIVDTSVWSLALRRGSVKQSSPQVDLLRDLIQQGQVVLLGAIRQELLSGIQNTNQYVRLREELRLFPDLLIETEDYETAAEFFNTCRRNGVQGSNTDFLICAVAQRRDYLILTTDQDFQHFSQYIPIRLC